MGFYTLWIVWKDRAFTLCLCHWPSRLANLEGLDGLSGAAIRNPTIISNRAMRPPR